MYKTTVVRVRAFPYHNFEWKSVRIADIDDTTDPHSSPKHPTVGGYGDKRSDRYSRLWLGEGPKVQD